jgi:hypothetical protein
VEKAINNDRHIGGNGFGAEVDISHVLEYSGFDQAGRR